MSPLLNDSWQKKALQAQQASLPVSPEAWQVEALTRFLEAGFPTRQHENWRYTNLDALAKTAFSLASSVARSFEIAPFVLENTYRLTFINGHYSAELSDIADLPAAVVLEARLNSRADYPIASHYQTPFSSLNAALLTPGLSLHIPKGVALHKPVHLLYLNTGEEDSVMHHPCHRVVAGAQSSAVVFEEYVGLSDAVYFNNVVTQIVAEAASQVQHYKLQRESDQAFHIANTVVLQKRDSQVGTANITLGSMLSRDDLNYGLSEEGTSATLLGLYYLMGHRHVDHHSRIDHVASHCASDQSYKGIVGDSSRAVFNGKVVVHADTEQTTADQSNQNLLLSSSAEIDTKPELEIYADDVKCTHGATIGQLDNEALFYLQSRGIDREAAMQILTAAFAEEILESLPSNSVGQRIANQVTSHLAQHVYAKAVHHE